ncbi:MAG: radical SAM family heme chaperone HemW [Eubacteriales bacterium]|nr:radical SAM family heme chaperone HemW [Eubacteriales bacterium]
MKNKLGLYVHIPFCAAKCAYCDFYSLAGAQDRWEEYTAALCDRIRIWSARCAGYEVDTVYFGGGTPSVLGADRLTAILRTIRENYVLLDDAEITCEANPDSMTDGFLTGIREAGVNRLSMGIQSADDGELRQLGRIHTFAQAQDAFARARAAGFANLSVDLMYALPGQTMDGLRHSIRALLALQPEHLSCYGLTVEPDTPLGRSHPVLPEDDTQADMYLMLCEELRAAGYEHYEISNFARPSFRSRHNSRYWRQEDYLGFGPGAHSDFGGKRLEAPRSLDRWLSGELLEEDTDIDRAAEYLMLALRTSDGVDSERYQTVFRRDFAPVEQALRPLITAGYVQNRGRRWSLTESGFLLSNPILVSVLEAVEPEN